MVMVMVLGRRCAVQVLALESDPPYTVATIELAQGSPPASDLVRRSSPPSAAAQLNPSCI